MILRLAGWALAILALLWPAFYNGQPFIFYDTVAYVRAADAAVEKVIGLTTPWSARRERQPPTQSTANPEPRGAAVLGSSGPVQHKSIQSGRSIYYGALVYLGAVSGGFWLSVAIQAAALAGAMRLALRAFGLDGRPHFAMATATMALTTPAAFFASYLMPDVFAGIAIIACAALIALPGQPQRHRLAWFALLVGALCAHTSHVLIAGALLLMGFALQACAPVPARWWNLGTIAAALMSAVAAEKIFELSAQRFAGESPVRPPFITARVIDDGPGYRYLKATCPDNGFKVCSFLDRLPTAFDPFLWSNDPARGVYSATDPATQRALSEEQWRFGLAVVAWDPLEQGAASAKNMLRQLGLIGIPEFIYEDALRNYLELRLPIRDLDRARGTRAWHEAIPVHAFGWVGRTSFLLALGFILWRMSTAFRSIDPHLRTLIGVILLGVVLNAAICGVLAIPRDRFEGRIAWLVPFSAMLLAFSAASHPRGRALP